MTTGAPGSSSASTDTLPTTGVLIDPHDQAANARAITNSDGRIISAYPVPAHLAGGNPDPTVWIITDDLDQPPTTSTVLFPSDY